MAVVLNQREHAIVFGLEVAVALKAPAHAFEFREGFLHRRVRHIEFNRHRNGRQRIEHVVLASKIQHHVEVRQRDTVAPLRREVHLRTDWPHIDGTHLGVFAKAVAGDGARDLRHDALYGRVVGTQNCRAVKRHAVQEINKRLFQIAKIMAIGFHVVGINIGHHRHHGQQVQK